MNAWISEYILQTKKKRKNPGHCRYCSMREENIKKSFIPNLYWQILYFSLDILKGRKREE